MTLKEIDDLIAELSKSSKIEDYREYWKEKTPTDAEEIENRWLFAFLSVHTPWSANVRSYLLLKANKDKWRNNRDELMRLLKESKVGLYNMRCKAIWEFFQLKIRDKHEGESWVDYRDMLQDYIYGLGPAKTAFALEMIDPLGCEAVCLDTHMLQLYGYDTKEVSKVNSGKYYREIEEHWLSCCRKHDIEPFIARCLFWDQKQMQNSSAYWAYILE